MRDRGAKLQHRILPVPRDESCDLAGSDADDRLATTSLHARRYMSKRGLPWFPIDDGFSGDDVLLLSWDFPGRTGHWSDHGMPYL
jgi:hypothetical protein